MARRKEGTLPRTREEADLPALDVDAPGFARDPHRELALVRRQGPFARSRRGVEVLTHADVLALLSDGRLRTQDSGVYERYGGGARLLAFASDGLLSSMQGEKHGRIRRVFTTAFRIRNIEAHRPMIRATAEELVEPLVGAGAGDFVEMFTKPFPMTVLCRLLGIPVGEIPRFSAAATQLHLLAQTPLAPGFAAIEESLGVLWDYCIALIGQRRATPTDDALSALIRAEETEGRISDEELVWNVANLIFAGQDTTRYQLASAVASIVRSPGLWEQLQSDPALVPLAAEEALRHAPVVNFVVRIPTEDVVFGGLRMRAGRRVILNFQSASRDPARFPDPGAFRWPAAEAPPSSSFDVPFGYGMHFCVGAALARAELQEALGVLLARLARVRIVGVPAMTHPAAMLHGPESLPLEFAAV